MWNWGWGWTKEVTRHGCGRRMGNTRETRLRGPLATRSVNAWVSGSCGGVLGVEWWVLVMLVVFVVCHLYLLFVHVFVGAGAGAGAVVCRFD